MNSGGVSYFDRPVFSSDSSRVAYVEVTDASGVYKLVVSDLKFKQNNTFTIADPVVVVNTEKTRIAAVEKIQNKWNVLSFDFTAPDKVTKDEPCDDVKQLTWSADGKALAYVASKDGTSQIVLNKKSDILPLGEYPWPFAIRPDNAAVGIFVANSKANTAYLHQAFVSKGQKNTVYKEGAHLAFSKDGKHYAFVGIKNEKFMIVVDGKECPIYDRVTTPTFSPDNRFLVYRARQDNKRFVVIADLNGKTIKELPRYERVFDTTFTKDGQSVAYGVKDGNQIAWKVEKL
jgi:Tol biopolymer transport system component